MRILPVLLGQGCLGHGLPGTWSAYVMP